MQDQDQHTGKDQKKALSRKALWRMFAFFLVAFGGWSLVMLGKPYGVAHIREYSGGLGLVDTTINYTVGQVYQLMDQLGQAGRAAYGRFVLLDLVYIVIYMIFLGVGLNLFMRELGLSGSRIYAWRMLPVYAGMADFGEELSLLAILGNYPDRLDGVVEFMNLFTLAKLALFSLSVLMLVILVIRWLMLRVFTNRKAASSD
ncbi:MAG: hypothetical protein R6V73_13345 [Anaerolineales bacterium]